MNIESGHQSIFDAPQPFAAPKAWLRSALMIITLAGCANNLDRVTNEDTPSIVTADTVRPSETTDSVNQDLLSSTVNSIESQYGWMNDFDSRPIPEFELHKHEPKIRTDLMASGHDAAFVDKVIALLYKSSLVIKNPEGFALPKSKDPLGAAQVQALRGIFLPEKSAISVSYPTLRRHFLQYVPAKYVDRVITQYYAHILEYYPLTPNHLVGLFPDIRRADFFEGQADNAVDVDNVVDVHDGARPDQLWKLHLNARESVLQLLIKYQPNFVLANATQIGNLITHNQRQAQAADDYGSSELNASAMPTTLLGDQYQTARILVSAARQHPILLRDLMRRASERPPLFHLLMEIVGYREHLEGLVSNNEDIHNLLERSSSDEVDLARKIPTDWLVKSPDFTTSVQLERLKALIAANLSLATNFDAGLAKDRFLKSHQGKKIASQESRRVHEARQRVIETPLVAPSFFHIAHFGQGIDAFGLPAVTNEIQRQQHELYGASTQYALWDGETLVGKTKAEKEVWLNQFLLGFAYSQDAASMLIDGHANANGFAVLMEYDSVAVNPWMNKELAYENQRILNLTPQKLAKALKLRSDFRRANKIQEPDRIIFAACEGDYVSNTLQHLMSENGGHFSDVDLPIFVTGSQAGETTKFDGSGKQAIPNEFLREGLGLAHGISRIGRVLAWGNKPDATSRPTIYIQRLDEIELYALKGRAPMRIN